MQNTIILINDHSPSTILHSELHARDMVSFSTNCNIKSSPYADKTTTLSTYMSMHIYTEVLCARGMQSV